MNNDLVIPKPALITGFLRNPIFVREHGTWAILIIPLVTGFLRSENHSASVIPLLLANLFLFFAYHPFEIILQYSKTKSAAARVQNALFWFVVYLVPGIFFGLYAAISTGRYILFLFALAALCFLGAGILFQRKNKLSRTRELLGIIGLSLGAPAVLYFLDGTISPASVILWAFNVLFFLSSSLFVHLKMTERTCSKDAARAEEYRRILLQNTMYQMGLLGLLLGVKALNIISYPVVLAFLPMIIHCLYAAFPNGSPVNFKKVGFTFLAYSVFFGIMFAIKF